MLKIEYEELIQMWNRLHEIVTLYKQAMRPDGLIDPGPLDNRIEEASKFLEGQALVPINDMFQFDLVKRCLVKSSNNEPVPNDEPLFILRARDVLAYGTICDYIDRCKVRGLTPKDRIVALEEVANKFMDYRYKHPDKIKVPGSTHGK